MIEPVNVGDLVISIAGRDKGKTFLVISIENEFVYLVDGKTRKVDKPKKKKIKHLKKVFTASLIKYAERIQNGESVGNEKLNRAIKAEQEKLQED